MSDKKLTGVGKPSFQQQLLMLSTVTSSDGLPIHLPVCSQTLLIVICWYEDISVRLPKVDVGSAISSTHVRIYRHVPKETAYTCWQA